MTIYSAAIMLFLVMDPFGNIPIFLSVLSHVDPKRRGKIIIRELLIALLFLIFFLFFGKYILEGMHITEPALGIAGGTILFLIAIKMIFPASNSSFVNDEDKEGDPLIVPLAVPMVAGPSSMAMVILLSTQYPDQQLSWLAALLISWSLGFIILISAEKLSKIVGRRTLKAIERLMGMILTTMSVQMLLTGIKTFMASV
ncbi:MAG: YhgN family NAAT transporter [Spirochaetia bacterium]|jgi:multiple antibiotic resistance protein|nr:YhgN family NAAT transporter [Spirochaetia bacterium]